jgi:hypothetical protein
MERESLTYTKEELLERLCEPYGSLSAEVISAAESRAMRDPNIAAALAECRAMVQLEDTLIFGVPQTSEAEFLAAFRNRLAASNDPHPALRSVFGTRRLSALITAVCMFVMVVILAAGNRSTPTTAQTVNAQALENLASALDPTVPIVPDSISDSTAVAESLAVYLNMPELASNWDFDTDNSDTDQPVSDELLGLDPQTLQEVLNDIENANFF